MMIKKLTKIVFSLLLASVFAVPALAAESLPQMMTGKTTISQTIDGVTSDIAFGGNNGNYVVLNTPENSVQLGFGGPILMSDDCRSVITGNVACFVLKAGLVPPFLDYNKRSVQVMRSKTKVTGADGESRYVYELPALFLNSNILSGDTFGNIADYLYWGKNFAQKSDSGDSTWRAGTSYTMNDGAQSSWLSGGSDTAVFKQYDAGVRELAANGTGVTASIVLNSLCDSTTKLCTWNLQRSSINNTASADETTKYPNGKTWYVAGNLTLGTGYTYKYSGVGTIIVKGNLVLGIGTSIKPANPDVDKLGIIVLSD